MLLPLVPICARKPKSRLRVRPVETQFAQFAAERYEIPNADVRKASGRVHARCRRVEHPSPGNAALGQTQGGDLSAPLQLPKTQQPVLSVGEGTIPARPDANELVWKVRLITLDLPKQFPGPAFPKSYAARAFSHEFIAARDEQADLPRAKDNSHAAARSFFHQFIIADPTPSEADIKVTRELIRAGQLLKIEVLDHVIIGAGRHSSLRSLGYFS